MTDSSHASKPMLVLPRATTASGAPRRVGIEIEMGGLEIATIVAAVVAEFGGKAQAENRFVQRIATDVGDFQIELDASVLKDRAYREQLERFGIRLDDESAEHLDDWLADAAGVVVPHELVAPPLVIDTLPRLDRVRAHLHEQGARGTAASLLYAFGLQANIEIATDDPAWLVDILRAFFLLYEAIREADGIDLTRRLSPYIKPFPGAYQRRVLDPDYAPDRVAFIDDYLRHNPTRNRPLDLLPLLAELDPERIAQAPVEHHLVKARPAFHYRLPNSQIDRADWTLADPLDGWARIERLAEQRDRLDRLARAFLDQPLQQIGASSDQLSREIRRWWNGA